MIRSDDVGLCMPSSPLESTHSVERHRAWHVIIALGQNTQSYDIGRTCHHCPWEEHTVRLCQAWHAISTLESTCSDDVRIFMTSSPLDNTHCRMTLMWHAIMPMFCTHVQTTSGVACHHRPYAAYMVVLRVAWHAIIAIGQNTRSNDVGCYIESSPFDSTQGRMTSGMACHHFPWKKYTVG